MTTKSDNISAEPDSQSITSTISNLAVSPALVGKRRSFPLSQTFTAFKYYNYRLWFVGQLISLTGTWMQTTAQGYLIFELTHSPAYLGYVGFATGAPSWFFMLYGGVIADRIPRRKLLMIAQIAMMILAFILAILTFPGLIQPWQIILMALALGIANAFDAPARQSFVVELVPREDLTNAIALNASMFNLATVVGPAVGGITYAFLGPAWCFTINAISFIAVITGLAFMRLKPSTSQQRATAVLDDLLEGVRYTASNSIIRTLIGIAAVTSLAGLAYMTLIPAWAVNILGGDSKTNGWLQSARGVGALAGALMIASLGRFTVKGKLLTLSTFVFPIMLLIFAEVRWLPLSLLVMAGVGWAMIVLFNLANVLIQTVIPDELRGRVLSIYTFTFFGLMPLGSLLTGAVAEAVGEPLTIVLSALISLGFAVLLWIFMPKLRRLE